MTKYEQIILKFKISDLKSDENRLEVQKELSLNGAAGYKLVNSHIHAAHEVNNDNYRYLFCIMEREYYEAEEYSKVPSLNNVVSRIHSMLSEAGQNNDGDDEW